MAFIFSIAPAVDGCSDNPGGTNPETEMLDMNSGSAFVQCCSQDGARCYRKDNNGACFSGSGLNNDDKKTWYEAYAICISAADPEDSNLQLRLCNTQDELDKCCGNGCRYDDILIWTDSTAAGK